MDKSSTSKTSKNKHNPQNVQLDQTIHSQQKSKSLSERKVQQNSFIQTRCPPRRSPFTKPSLIFLNDLISSTFPNVKAVQYADDLALICSEDSLILAQKRLQTTLNRLDQWTTVWSMKVNATKTTYTVFSLSNKEQTVNLKLEGQNLKRDICHTYLGILEPRNLF